MVVQIKMLWIGNDSKLLAVHVERPHVSKLLVNKAMMPTTWDLPFVRKATGSRNSVNTEPKKGTKYDNRGGRELGLERHKIVQCYTRGHNLNKR
jgi:hypothetical protein